MRAMRAQRDLQPHRLTAPRPGPRGRGRDLDRVEGEAERAAGRLIRLTDPGVGEPGRERARRECEVVDHEPAQARRVERARDLDRERAQGRLVERRVALADDVQRARVQQHPRLEAKVGAEQVERGRGGQHLVVAGRVERRVAAVVEQDVIRGELADVHRDVRAALERRDDLVDRSIEPGDVEHRRWTRRAGQVRRLRCPGLLRAPGPTRPDLGREQLETTRQPRANHRRSLGDPPRRRARRLVHRIIRFERVDVTDRRRALAGGQRRQYRDRHDPAAPSSLYSHAPAAEHRSPAAGRQPRPRRLTP